MLWDVFCEVIDNHGDIGVCWRLACNLAERGESVRLWIDDPSALEWMAPQGASGVVVSRWETTTRFPPPGDVVVEAFGCEPAPAFVAAMAAMPTPPRWINLEYLTAERYALRSHGLPSPVLSGPGSGLTRHFFYPGFTAESGGLLREADLQERQARFDRTAWLRGVGVDGLQGRCVSLFCYEPFALAELLRQLAQSGEPMQLLVTAGRAASAVRAVLQQEQLPSALAITWLPLLTQIDYDHLLRACDLNFVRGEDSLVRALWSGRPFCWQIYPQSDGAHHAKLEAFLGWLEAPQSLRQFHRGWNGVTSVLPPIEVAAWQACVKTGRERLLAQDALVPRLLRFVAMR